jgi:hypothetical protein
MRAPANSPKSEALIERALQLLAPRKELENHAMAGLRQAVDYFQRGGPKVINWAEHRAAITKVKSTALKLLDALTSADWPAWQAMHKGAAGLMKELDAGTREGSGAETLYKLVARGRLPLLIGQVALAAKSAEGEIAPATKGRPRDPDLRWLIHDVAEVILRCDCRTELLPTKNFCLVIELLAKSAGKKIPWSIRDAAQEVLEHPDWEGLQRWRELQRIPRSPQSLGARAKRSKRRRAALSGN